MGLVGSGIFTMQYGFHQGFGYGFCEVDVSPAGSSSGCGCLVDVPVAKLCYKVVVFRSPWKMNQIVNTQIAKDFDKIFVFDKAGQLWRHLVVFQKDFVSNAEGVWVVPDNLYKSIQKLFANAVTF